MERTRRWVLGTCLTVSTAAAGRQSIFGGSDDAPSVDNGDEDDDTPDQGTTESDQASPTETVEAMFIAIENQNQQRVDALLHENSPISTDADATEIECDQLDASVVGTDPTETELRSSLAGEYDEQTCAMVWRWLPTHSKRSSLR